MSTHTHRFFNNTGGLNLRFQDTHLSDNDAEEIENMHSTNTGAWTTLDVGYVQKNTSPLATGATVNGLYAFYTESGQSHLIASAGGKLHTISPGDGTWSVIHEGLDASATVQFVTFQGVLICLNGVDAPIIWTGQGEFENLVGWPPAISGLTTGNPSYGEIFNNRLVLSGDAQNPSVVYLSEQENPENFTPDDTATGAGAIHVAPGDGEKVTGLKSMYLPVTNEEILVIFKERSTYVLFGQDADSFQLEKVSDSFGAVSHRSVIRLANELLFLSQDGVTSLTTATQQGNLVTQFVSQNIQPQISQLNRNQLHQSFAVHLPDRQEVWWAVPDGGSTQNQRILIMNYGTGGITWSRRSGIEAASGALLNGKLYTGDYSGLMHQQLTGSSYNGEPIPWTYRTPFYDLGNSCIRKRIRDVELYLKQLNAMSISVKTAWDIRRNQASQTERVLTIYPDSGSALFGTAVYGADLYGLAGVSIVPFMPDGSGRFFQIEFSGEAADQPIELQGWSITSIPGSYR